MAYLKKSFALGNQRTCTDVKISAQHTTIQWIATVA